MEIFLTVDRLTSVTLQGMGMAKFLLRSHCVSSCEPSSDQPSSSGVLQVSAAMVPVGAVAPPPVKSDYLRTSRRRLSRKTRRVRRKPLAGGGADDGGFYGDVGGPFGGDGGGCGGGWNFYRSGWSNWDDFSSSSSSDPAFDFVYEVICWIALSKCLYFAFKKVARIMAEGISHPERIKVPMRFVPIC